MDIDVGYGQISNSDSADSANVNNNQEVTTNLDDGSVKQDPTGAGAADISDNNSKQGTGSESDESNDSADSNSELTPGTSIDVGEDTYTVDDKGNVIDKNGNIFKEANAVKEWLDSFENVEDTTDGTDGGINIDAIRNAVGVDVVDKDNKPVEFENSVDGIKSYIDAVIENGRNENYETAINTLYQRYPILNDVLNYYIANGNSLEGFAEMPDHSNIVIDKANEAQQEAIIRSAWKERNQKGDVDSYIDYLKSSGTLFASAEEELRGLQELDAQYRDQLAAEAKQREDAQAAQLQQYWGGVYDAIQARNIAGYQIPESIIISRDGQKLSVTPDDFFNYIYRVDKDGKSAYQYDLEAETPESRRDDEILRAYLKFVGGNYSNLVDMAINKEKVNNLKLRAKERNAKSIRINKPKTVIKGTEIDLGYN